MVKKLASISIVAGVTVITACFGEGPTPPAPTRATILFTGTPIPGCGEAGTYIGPVAIGAGSGFVTMLPFTLQGGGYGDCHGGGSPPPTQPQTVFAFNKDGGSLTKVGSAGMTEQNIQDRITTTPTGVAYIYGDSSNGQLTVDPGGMTVGSNMGQGGIAQAYGIAQSGSDLYVEIGNSNSTGFPPTDNPEYPCCGGGDSAALGNIYRVRGNTSLVQIAPMCSTTDTCFVGNSASLIYFERPTTGWQLTKLDTATLSTTKVASSGGGDFPVGLDANDTTIAYSSSLACQIMNQSDNCNVNMCNVFAYDIASGMLKSLLSTHEWGCMDAKLADGYVYFTIVAYSPRTEHIYGRGIGRVSIADKTFESLDLGIQGDAAGPRRVYPSGGQLYLVDPLVMARIDASELAGKHDFAP